MKVTQDQVNHLNSKIQAKVYAVHNGMLVANPLTKKQIKDWCLDDLVANGKLTDRATRFAEEILGL